MEDGAMANEEQKNMVFGDVELRIDGKPIQLNVAEEIKLDPRDAIQARRALSRWIEDCERQAEDAWSEGRSGYLGRIKFSAFVDDDGLKLRIERSIEEAL
jgi:hypothetical protein